MKDLLEIRWHGRGGQGVKTAALLFADAMVSQGKHVQAFPEYGPERMGAPVQSFNRFSSEVITIHCGVENPDVVVLLDPTLIGKIDITAGLGPEGKLIVNTSLEPKELREKLDFQGGNVYTLDASRIAQETIGRNIPNTPMIGALVRATGLLPLKEFIEDTEKKLQKKFRHKPEVIQGNLEAIKKAYDEVKGE